MFAEIIPALRLPPRFSVFDYLLPDGLALNPGDVVRVPFRSRIIAGVVKRVKDATDMAGPLKMVAGTVGGLCFDIDDLEWASKAYRASLPLLAFTFLPSAPRREADLLRADIAVAPQRSGAGSVLKPSETLIFRTPEERLAAHAEIVRRTMDAGLQTLILAPEETDLDFLADGLRSVAPDLITLSGSLGIRDAWASMLAFGRGAAPLLVGTRLAVLTPARNLGAFIIDREEDPSHKQSDANPRYDAKEIAGRRASRLGVPLAAVSETPSIRVFLNKPDTPLPSGAAPLVINLKDHWRGGNSGLLSRPLIDALAAARQNGKLSILLHNRKGLGGLVICRDCREAVVCESCRRPLAAERSGLLCRICGTARDIPLFCENCRGPRIAIQRLGIQRLAQDIQKIIPGASVAEIARRREGQAPPSLPAADVLLGTEVMLHWYRKELFDLRLGLVGVILADSLWQKPEYAANEEAFTVLVSLRNISEKAGAPFVVQTLDPEHRVLQALSGKPSNFYRMEIEDRERLGYPPAGTLIKMTSSSRRQDDAQTKRLASSLEEIGATVRITGLRAGRSQPAAMIVARLPNDEALRFKAVSLADQDWTVDVNPRNLFD